MLVSKEDSKEAKASDPSQENTDEPVENTHRNPQQQRRRSGQEQPPSVWTPTDKERTHEIPFTSNSGMQVQMVEFQPFDYFSLFINEDLMNYLVTETNLFTEQFISGGNISRKIRVKNWHPTYPHEIKQFLGLLFVTGNNHKETCFLLVLVLRPPVF